MDAEDYSKDAAFSIVTSFGGILAKIDIP